MKTHDKASQYQILELSNDHQIELQEAGIIN